jgi:PIN domain nuclease of toxin-antitoxin system
MVILEIQYLFEAGRINHSAETIVSDLMARVGLRVSDQSLARIISHALKQRWTRDPFDRLIVGNALAEGVSLLSCDETILANCPSAKWGPPATEPPPRKAP